MGRSGRAAVEPLALMAVLVQAGPDESGLRRAELLAKRPCSLKRAFKSFSAGGGRHLGKRRHAPFLAFNYLDTPAAPAHARQPWPALMLAPGPALASSGRQWSV